MVSVLFGRVKEEIFGDTQEGFNLSPAHAKRRREKSASEQAEQATSGGKRVAQKRAKRSLRLSPTLIGAFSLLIAGTGSVVVTFTNRANDMDEQYQSIASIYSGDISDINVSRDFDRILAEQTEVQAAQLEQALAAFAGEVEDKAADLKKNQWVLPVVGYRLSSLYGERSRIRSGPHSGIDMAAPTGTKIVAITEGTVTRVGFRGACGLGTMVRLKDNWQMMYCHQSKTAVKVGDYIKPGQLIGYVGSTGNSTGPHLHLEIWTPDNRDVNPMPILREHGVNP